MMKKNGQDCPEINVYHRRENKFEIVFRKKGVLYRVKGVLFGDSVLASLEKRNLVQLRSFSGRHWVVERDTLCLNVWEMVGDEAVLKFKALFN